MIRLLPAWLCPVAVAALIGVGLYQRSNLHEERALWAAERLESAKMALRSIEVAQAETIRLQGVKDEAVKKANIRADANKKAAAAAGSERDRLRDELDAASRDLPGLPHQACLARADALSAVLAECARAFTGMAGKAEGHANDAMTFDEAWPDKSGVTEKR